MIEDITFTPKAAVAGKGNKPAIVGKLFKKHEDDKWQEATWGMVLATPLAEFISGNVRIIIELWIDGERMFIASHEEDQQMLHVKHPSKVIAGLQSIYRFLADATKKAQTSDDLIALAPKILLCLHEFPGAEVIK